MATDIINTYESNALWEFVTNACNCKVTWSQTETMYMYTKYMYLNLVDNALIIDSRCYESVCISYFCFICYASSTQKGDGAHRPGEGVGGGEVSHYSMYLFFSYDVSDTVCSGMLQCTAQCCQTPGSHLLFTERKLMLNSTASDWPLSLVQVFNRYKNVKKIIIMMSRLHHS